MSDIGIGFSRAFFSLFAILFLRLTHSQASFSRVLHAFISLI